MRLKAGCKGAGAAAAAAIADRIAKALALEAAPSQQDAIPGVLRFSVTGNTGMAFSMFSGSGAWLIALTAVLIAGVTAWLIAHPGEPKLARTGLWLVVGGGLGNLYDRVVYGSVIDFIELRFVRFAVFNVADACICAGVLMAIIALLCEEAGKGNQRAGTDH